MNLALILNHRCNLRCRYCYTGRKFARAMPLDVARRAVEFGFDQSRTGELTLSFFGGEPLMEIDALEAIVLYAEKRAVERGMKLRFAISTNGTLMDQRRLALLRDHDFHVQVSVDGVAAAQDLARPFEDGRTSHVQVHDNLRLLIAEKLLHQIVAVMDPSTVHWLCESYLFLVDLGATDIYFAPNLQGDWTPEACEHFEHALRELADAYLDTFRRGQVVRMDPLYGKIVTHLVRDKKTPRRCGFGDDEMAVAPSGNIYPCDRMVREDGNSAMRLGDLDHGLVPERVQAVQKSRCERDPECEDCELAPRCAQWCGCAQWETTRTLGRVSQLFCWFERSFIVEADRVADILFEARIPSFLREFYELEAVTASPAPLLRTSRKSSKG